MNRAEIFYFTGKILSLDFVSANRKNVFDLLSSSYFPWQSWVKVGSDNLVLPAIYLKLQNHNLLNLLPDDLREYLHEIFILNRERNQKISQQLNYIRQLLRAEGVKFVVMKGVGNILEPLYSDPGERMVFDIDLLVEEGKMLQAAAVLEKNGFFTQKPFNHSSLESTMHYPILLREDFVAGVEIHGMPVQYLYQEKFPRTTAIIANSTLSRDGYNLMNYKDRILHNFIHSQLMHSGYYHGIVSLRDLYDLMLLGRSDDLLQVFVSHKPYREAAFGYLRLMYDVFGIDVPEKLKSVTWGQKFPGRNRFIMNLSSPKRKNLYITITLLQKYFILPGRIVFNKNARNYVLSRLLDRSWYKRHIAGIKRMFR